MSWKRILWIVALTVTFAAIQLRASRRDAKISEANDRPAQTPADSSKPDASTADPPVVAPE